MLKSPSYESPVVLTGGHHHFGSNKSPDHSLEIQLEPTRYEMYSPRRLTDVKTQETSHETRRLAMRYSDVQTFPKTRSFASES